MYLISAYFDEITTFKIQQYIDQVAKKTGNTFMIDNCVPPHITISAFHTKHEEQVIGLLEQKITKLKSEIVQWVSVGTFFPNVIYLIPVLNQYLHTLSLNVYNCITQVENISISSCYQPFCWMPHTTIGKKLTNKEMLEAFQVLQHQFGTFSGQITKIGLAKTNPYKNLAVFELIENEARQ